MNLRFSPQGRLGGCTLGGGRARWTTTSSDRVLIPRVGEDNREDRATGKIKKGELRTGAWGGAVFLKECGAS
jgi:hypothetical protein